MILQNKTENTCTCSKFQSRILNSSVILVFRIRVCDTT